MPHEITSFIGPSPKIRVDGPWHSPNFESLQEPACSIEGGKHPDLLLLLRQFDANPKSHIKNAGHKHMKVMKIMKIMKCFGHCLSCSGSFFLCEQLQLSAACGNPEESNEVACAVSSWFNP